MAGLRARRTTASDDKNARVIFRAGEAIGGDRVPALPPGTTLPLTVEITDPDEPDARYRVDVLSDHPGGDRARRPIESFRIEGNTNGRYALDGILADRPGQFVMLRIIQSSARTEDEGDDEHEETEDRIWTAPIWFEASASQAIAMPAIQIVDMMPNPIGEDAIGEDVQLQNSGQSPIDLTGWQLRDLAANTWTLNITVPAGQRITIVRNGAGMLRNHGQQMSLNNDGDLVELVMPDGTVVDSVRYGRAIEGARMSPVR